MLQFQSDCHYVYEWESPQRSSILVVKTKIHTRPRHVCVSARAVSHPIFSLFRKREQDISTLIFFLEDVLMKYSGTRITLRVAALLLTLAMAVPFGAWAQTFRGGINGTVTDQSDRKSVV